MADNRLARDMGTREIAQRPQAWKPPETLPTPAPQAGWVFRWVRTSLLGQFDPTNTSAKFREGWEPVKASDHPELQHTPDGSLNARFKDNVEIGGLVLCKAPSETMLQRNAYYAKQTNAQMEAVDNNYMRQSDARMPLFSEKRSSTTFGRGTK